MPEQPTTKALEIDRDLYETIVATYGLRHDLTPKQVVEALRIGRIKFKSAGAVRQR